MKKTGIVLLQFAVIFIVGLTAYGHTFNYPFHFDDAAFVVENPDIRHLNDVKSIFNAVLPTKSRPIGFFTFALNYHFHQLKLFGYHLTNFIILWLTAICVWFLTRILIAGGKRGSESRDFLIREAPLFAALFFIVHPANTQAVTYISQRFQSLASLFYIAAVCCYLYGRLWPITADNNVRRKIYFFKILPQIILFSLSILFAVLGMLTKEVVATLPLMIVFTEIFIARPYSQKSSIKKTDSLRREWRLYGVGGMVLFGLCLLLPRVFGFNIIEQLNRTIYSLSHHGDVLNFKTYFLTEFRVFAKYLQLLFFPVGFNLDPDFPMSHHLFEWATLGGLCVFLAVGAFAVFLRNRQRVIAFGIFWFLITFLVEFFPREHVMGDHKLYLLGIGPVIAVTVALIHFLKPRFARYAVFLFIIGLLIFLTYQRNKVWKDDVALWGDVVKQSPQKARSLSNAYLDAGFQDPALECYTKAISLEQYHYKAYFNRGVLYERKGMLDNAIEDYSRTIILKPNYAKAYGNRGYIYKIKNDTDKAMSDYSKAIELDPKNENIYSNRGVMYKSLGQYDKALADFDKAIFINPYFFIVYNNRGIIYKLLAQYDKAEKDFLKAIELNSKNWVIHRNLALVYIDTIKYDLA